jgi:putative membrane protein
MSTLLGNFAVYALSAFGVFIASMFIILLVTRHKEFELIGKGNQAAALSFGGKLLGIAFVLGSAITNSVSLIDMVIWGLVGLVAQLLFFFLSELLTIRFSISDAIEKDNKAVGILLLLLSLSVGWIIASCLTY